MRRRREGRGNEGQDNRKRRKSILKKKKWRRSRGRKMGWEAR